MRLRARPTAEHRAARMPGQAWSKGIRKVEPPDPGIAGENRGNGYGNPEMIEMVQKTPGKYL
jgi:hypothetical protein